MKIRMIVPNLRPAPGGLVVGGAAKSAVNLATALVSRGHDVGLIAGTMARFARTDVASDVPWSSVEVIPVRARGSTTAYGAEFVARLSRMLLARSDPPDLVHGHSGYAPYLASTALAGGLLRCPSVHSLYCPVPASESPVGKSARSVLLNSTGIVAAMSRNVEHSVQVAGGKRTAWLPPVIPGHAIESAPVPRAVRPTVTFVGSTSPTKGLDVLLRAFARLRQRIPARLLLAIEPPDGRRGRADSEIRSLMTSLDLGEDVRVVGLVDDMPGFLGSSDLVVLPFRSTDGPSDYPLVLLEAMSASAPVIATAVGGIPEIVQDGETGLLCPPDDPTVLAEKMYALLTNGQLRRHVAEGGARFVTQAFHPEVVAERAEQIYEGLLNAK